MAAAVLIVGAEPPVRQQQALAAVLQEQPGPVPWLLAEQVQLVPAQQREPLLQLVLARPQVLELPEQALLASVPVLPLQASHQAVRTCASWFQRRQPLCGRG